jgi:hypothetical protein
MKPKHVLAFAALASLVLVGGCSGDDDDTGDLCQEACLKLEGCGTGVICNGLELEPDACAERCRASKAESNARCVLDEESCDANALGICSGGIRC